MSFVVRVWNKGVDGTIRVTERLNLNQNIVVFEDVLSDGEVRNVNCQGTPPKEFDWIHLATNSVGGPESKNDGDDIEVKS